MVGVKTENCSAFSSLQSALIFQSQIMVWSPENWEWSGWKPCRQDVFRDRLHHHFHHQCCQGLHCQYHHNCCCHQNHCHLDCHNCYHPQMVGNPAGRTSTGTGCIMILAKLQNMKSCQKKAALQSLYFFWMRGNAMSKKKCDNTNNTNAKKYTIHSKQAHVLFQVHCKQFLPLRPERSWGKVSNFNRRNHQSHDYNHYYII